MNAYVLLFGAALLAATLVPAQSEAVLATLILQDQYSVGLLVLVASLGNTLGSLINWWLGRSLEQFRERPWFPVKPAQLERAQTWFQRYGKWSLLFSWVPVLGDPLTLVAGTLRIPLLTFITLVFSAKALRYIVIAWFLF